MEKVFVPISVLKGFSWKIQQKNVNHNVLLVLQNRLRGTVWLDALVIHRLLATTRSAITVASTPPIISMLTTQLIFVSCLVLPQKTFSRTLSLAIACYGAKTDTSPKMVQEPVPQVAQLAMRII